jgi:SAM-dependent methyltransferase
MTIERNQFGTQNGYGSDMAHTEAASHEGFAGALRCPVHPKLGRLVPASLAGEAGLRCSECDRIFPIRDGIPDLVVGQDDPAEFREAEARQWDEQAHRYEQRRRQDPRYMAGVQAAVEALQVRPGDLVLDAGCGTGFTVRSYLRPDVRVVALDLSLESLRYLRNTLAVPVDLVRGDLAMLPFANATFDRVLCANALQHIPDDRQRYCCIQELARVARPKARVVVTAHHWSVSKKSAGMAKEGPAGGYSGPVQYIYRFDRPEFRDLLGSSLQVERITGGGFPVPYRLKLTPLSRVLERFLRRRPAAVPFADMLVGTCTRQ